MIRAVYEQREQIKDLHARLRAGGGVAAAGVSLEQVTWAEQVVWSRAFASDVARGGTGAPPPPPTYLMGVERKVRFEAATRCDGGLQPYAIEACNPMRVVEA